LSEYANAEIEKGDFVVITEVDYGPGGELVPLTGIPAVVASLSWPFALLQAANTANPVDRRKVVLAKVSKEYHDSYWAIANKAESSMVKTANTTEATTTCPNCGGKMRVVLSPNQMATFVCPECGIEGVGFAANK